MRRIERQARQTVDPLERLRYVRTEMDSGISLAVIRRLPVVMIVAFLAVAMGAVLLVFRIQLFRLHLWRIH